MKAKENVAAIVGPTAVGKTAISVLVASQIEAEIISVDSMQVYRGMDIGTAKIREEEMYSPQGIKIPHHLIDLVNPDKDFSVADFQEMAREKIWEINQRGRIALLVGGTGLYLNAVIDNYDFIEMEIDWKYRKNLENQVMKFGYEHLHSQLTEIDPETAAKLHPKDTRRIIRALEIYAKTGKTVSELQFSSKPPPLYNMVLTGLTMERNILYERINDRVDKMMEEGLVDEVMGLLSKGYDLKLNPMQSLGYRQISAYLTGTLTREEAVNILKRDTRRYAKRQMTWFKRDERIKWFEITDKEKFYLAGEISDYIRRTLDVAVE